MPSVSASPSPRIAVTISDDCLTASIELGPNAAAHPLSVAGILEALETAGVWIGDEVRQRAEEVVELAAGREGPLSFVVATGTPPQGRDETFVWNSQLQATAADWLSDVPIDFYTLNNIITIEKDTPIGTITPIVPPKDGRDVEGEVIRATHEPVVIKLGDTVRRADDDAASIIANVAGKVVERGNTLSIDETLVIKGDVGFETGNIDSKVSVHINKGVPDRFEVKSCGDVAVGMSIEAARVSAGGDVTVSRGIVGRGTGLVTAGGNITFKYCADAHLVAAGDVKVSKQSMNSHLCIGGDLVAGTASLVGGTVFAEDRVDLANIGSQRHIPTRIVVGVYPHLIRDMAVMQRRMPRVEELAEQIRDVLAPLHNSDQPLSTAQDERATSLLARADEATNVVAGDKEGWEELLAKVYTDEPSSVHVSGTIFVGTIIRVADRETVFYKDMQGPLYIEKRKLDRVTELVAVNKLTASIKILTTQKKPPTELIDELKLEEDPSSA